MHHHHHKNQQKSSSTPFRGTNFNLLGIKVVQQTCRWLFFGMLQCVVSQKLTNVSEVSIITAIEEVSSSEILVNFYQTTGHNIPEHSNLHTCHYENLDLTNIDLPKVHFSSNITPAMDKGLHNFYFYYLTTVNPSQLNSFIYSSA